MLCLQIGKCKCLHRPCQKWEWETPGSFIILSEIVKAASSAREANEWKGERSANNVPWTQIKVSVLLLSFWADEMLLWFLIKKRKILKEMWAACPGNIFRSQPHLVKPVTEMMLAGAADQAEPLAKSGGRWIAVSRGLYQGSQAARLVPSSLQFTSRAGVELVMPVSSRHHAEPISPSVSSSPHSHQSDLPCLSEHQHGRHGTSPLGQADTSMLRGPEKEGNASHSSAVSPLPRKGTQLTSQSVSPDLGFQHFSWPEPRQESRETPPKVPHLNADCISPSPGDFIKVSFSCTIFLILLILLLMFSL